MTRLTKISACIIILTITLLVNSALSQNWQSLGYPSIGTANVRDLAVGRATSDQNPTFYDIEGTTIYSSLDGGTTWNTTSSVNGTPLAVTCKQYTPTYVVTNYIDASLNGNVVYSTDAGGTWQFSDVYQDPHAIAFRMATLRASYNQQIMLMGMEYFNTFHSMKRSTNGGYQWNGVDYFYSTAGTDVVTLAPHKTIAKHVFAGGVTPPVRNAGFSGAAPLTITYTNGAFFSVDSGITWNRFSNTNVNKDVWAMTAYKSTSPNYNYVFAATADSNLYRMYYSSTGTPSAAASWTKVANFPKHVATRELNVGENKYIFAATNNGIYISMNNGSLWDKDTIGLYQQSDMQRVSSDPQSANNILTGSTVNLYKSIDEGCTWRGISPSTAAASSISAVSINGATLIAVPTNNSVVSRKTGSAWSTLGLNTINDFVGTMIGFKSSDGAVALDVGYRSTSGFASIWRNGNNGDNTCGNAWVEVRTGSYNPGKYNGFITDPANSDRVYAFGLVQNGNSSTNENYSAGVSGGTQWARNAVPTLTQTNISEIADFAADSTGHGTNNYSLKLFAAIYNTATSNQGIWKSTNGGTSWTNIYNQQVRGLGFNPASTSTIYAVRDDSLCFFIDNGSTWNTRGWPPTSSGIVSRLLMHPSYPNSSNYFWIIRNGSVYRTINGGTSWITVPTSGTPGGTVFQDLRRDLTSIAIIYAATNNGVWKIDPVPEVPVGLWASTFAYCPCPYPPGCDPNAAFIEGVQSPCQWSYYAQLSWSANAEADVNATGGTYSIYRSTSHDGGYSQIASVPYTSTSYVDWSVRLPNPTTYYYKITTTDVGGNVSDTSDIVSIGGSGAITTPNRLKEEEGVPTSYKLMQNVPNPFNPNTVIEYSLPEAAHVVLIVYNVLGEEVITLVNETQDVGYKAVRFDASNLPSGIYLYKLTGGTSTSSVFTDVKKMILMK